MSGGRDESGAGLMSSAGLVRYFDAEDQKAVQIDPKTMVAWALMFGVMMQVVNAVGVGGEGMGGFAMTAFLAAFLGITLGLVIKGAMKGEI